MSLTIAVGDHPYTAGIKAGPTTTPSGLVLEPINVKPMVAGFRSMIRGLEFDVCEVAITTYLVAR